MCRRKGECMDNAPMESFFASLKKEMVHQRRFRTRAEAKAAIFEYIEVFYNRQRRHSGIMVRLHRVKGHQQVHKGRHRFDHACGHVRPNCRVQSDDFSVGVLGYFFCKTYHQRVVGNGLELGFHCRPYVPVKRVIFIPCVVSLARISRAISTASRRVAVHTDGLRVQLDRVAVNDRH
jgi:hypothetical protein